MKQTASLLVLVILAIGLFNFCKKKDNPNPDTNPCANTDLSISASVSGSTVTVSASGGTAPYTYSKDGNTYVNSGTFSGMTSGDHTVYVKDEKGCTKSTSVTVAGTGGNGGNGGGGNSSKLVDQRDGKEYTIVTIGDQVWMAENLNFEPEEEGSTCFEDVESNCESLGRLYTYELATEACPTGWHLPSGQEWEVLTDYIGGLAGHAAQLKEGGETGFEVKLGSGGYNYYTEVFFGSNSAYFWGSTLSEAGNSAVMQTISTSNDITVSWNDLDNKISVRCIKD
ncbi:MAG: FISUMP domain-containing protein [Cytophagaceae bacterium]